jgi:hypothetical protein
MVRTQALAGLYALTRGARTRPSPKVAVVPSQPSGADGVYAKRGRTDSIARKLPW